MLTSMHVSPRLADEKVRPFAEVIANSHCCDRSSSLSEDAGYGIFDQFMSLGEDRARKFAADEVMERLASSYRKTDMTKDDSLVVIIFGRS